MEVRFLLHRQPFHARLALRARAGLSAGCHPKLWAICAQRNADFLATFMVLRGRVTATTASRNVRAAMSEPQCPSHNVKEQSGALLAFASAPTLRTWFSSAPKQIAPGRNPTQITRCLGRIVRHLRATAPCSRKPPLQGPPLQGPPLCKGRRCARAPAQDRTRKVPPARSYSKPRCRSSRRSSSGMAGA